MKSIKRDEETRAIPEKEKKARKAKLNELSGEEIIEDD